MYVFGFLFRRFIYLLDVSVIDAGDTNIVMKYLLIMRLINLVDFRECEIDIFVPAFARSTEHQVAVHLYVVTIHCE